MASYQTQRQLHTQEVLDRKAVWHFRDGRTGNRDFERLCVESAAIPFRRDGGELTFCVLISSGASHLATIEVSPVHKSMKVTIFALENGVRQTWSKTRISEELAPGKQVSIYDEPSIHGGITDDGAAVMVVYRPASGSVLVYNVTNDTFTLREPLAGMRDSYSLHKGSLSDDSEYIFYTRDRDRFRSGKEVKAVEAYSIRNLARVKAVTFSYGDGRHLRNIRLLDPLRVDGPVYMAITTTGGVDDVRSSPMVVASSDGKTNWHASGLDKIVAYGAKTNASISPDGLWMFYVDKDDALVQQWDLKRPTLKPLGSVRLPGVDVGQSRRWLIHGQETTIRDAVEEKTHCLRYSPGCKVVTVVTVASTKVVINVFRTFNLQLVHHYSIAHVNWPGLVPLHAGFSTSAGLNIVGMSPTLTLTNQNGMAATVGVMIVLLPLQDIYEKIVKIEGYFDSTAAALSAIKTQPGEPICRYIWRPGVFDRDDAEPFHRELGHAQAMTEEDSRRQREFYDSVFATGSVAMKSIPANHKFMVPHLMSFSYPWDPKQTVSVFGVIMKNEYYVISIGSSPVNDSKAEVVRALYSTDITTMSNVKESIEFYKCLDTYILHVHLVQGGSSGYSGAPMPTPRWTIVSPHFLEEDAWYDIFVIHRAAHVTAPTGWSHTPNPALMLTSNLHAYFEPRTFVVQDMTDYGHRANSVYVQPKYLLWKEYGLRGLRKSHPNDIFFGGGRYADAIGVYLKSIYEDRTYDDSQALVPSAFALACNADYCSRATKHVDAFFRRLHQDPERVLANTQAVSYSLPLACSARPTATLSFMRHIVLFPHRINDIGDVEGKRGASSRIVQQRYDTRWYKLKAFIRDIYFFILPWIGWPKRELTEKEPNTKTVTLPLQGFCSFNNKLYRVPPMSHSSIRDDLFWDIVQATTPAPSTEPFVSWDAQMLMSVKTSSKGPASPFTRLVEEILRMKDRNTQLSFLRVVWLEKLLTWKMRKFGLHIYLTRIVLPILLLFAVHLSICLLCTDVPDENGSRISTVAFGCVELLLSCYILWTKATQIYRIPHLFFKSLPNVIDLVALSLGISLFGMIVSGRDPPREFLAFSTLLIWIAVILMLRIYRPVGMLLLLLTETLQETFSYLALLSFIILGFAFVPFLLLRNIASEDNLANPFSSFPLSFAQMLNFISSDYGALEPFEATSAGVRTLRALYIIVITILFLNTLIAILNVKIRTADKNSANLYHLQMASLQVEIELGLLSSSERARRDWFPEWFSYSMTETEQRVWDDFVKKNSLKWTEENNFNEDKDNAPLVDVQDISNQQTTSSTSSTTETLKDTMEEGPRPAQSTKTTTEPLIVHNGVPTSDLMSALGKIEDDDLPREDDLVYKAKTDKELLDELEAQAREAKAKRGKATTQPSSFISAAPPATPITPSTGTQDLIELSDLSCVICGEPGKRCQGCRLVAYCSKEHQREDWKNHKRECKGKSKTTGSTN